MHLHWARTVFSQFTSIFLQHQTFPCARWNSLDPATHLAIYLSALLQLPSFPNTLLSLCLLTSSTKQTPFGLSLTAFPPLIHPSCSTHPFPIWAAPHPTAPISTAVPSTASTSLPLFPPVPPGGGALSRSALPAAPWPLSQLPAVAGGGQRRAPLLPGLPAASREWIGLLQRTPLGCDAHYTLRELSLGGQTDVKG